MPWNKVDVMDQKQKFVMEALRGEAPFRQLCRRYGISTVTGYIWRDRFLAEGLAGLRERSRRPRSNSTQLSEETVCQMVRIKQAHTQQGPEKIQDLYRRIYGVAPSLSSFKRVLAKAGLVQPRKTRRRTDPSALRPPALEAKAPNHIWTVDFKGWWRTDHGRCEPLTVRDAYSRFVLGVQAMATTKTQAVQPHFERLFNQYGLPQTIHTDNGAPFAAHASPLGLSRLSAWWVALGIQLSRSRPGRPGDNAAHERMHKDLEALQPRIERNSGQAQAILDHWQHEFNWQRPHRALHMRFPGEVYSASERKYPGELRAIEYGPDFITRRVSSAGAITLHNCPFFISNALAAWDVGLRQVSSMSFEVWFDYLLLGRIDLSAARFIWARPDEAPVSI